MANNYWALTKWYAFLSDLQIFIRLIITITLWVKIQSFYRCENWRDYLALDINVFYKIAIYTNNTYFNTIWPYFLKMVFKKDFACVEMCQWVSL